MKSLLSESPTSLLLDFGLQPICNRFPSSPEEPEARFPLALALNESSGLLRLRDPISPDELRPRVGWISYQEPEEHLDTMLSKVVSAAQLRPDARILGVSRYDQTAVTHLGHLGFTNGRVLDPALHLALPAGSGTESVQARIRPESMVALEKEIGRFDLIIARYILEHTHDLAVFCRGLSVLLNDRGLILFEVPDFTPSLEAGEYCNVWEEHAFYFTPASLRHFFSDHDFDILAEQMYLYPLENSFIVLIKPSTGRALPLSDTNPRLDCAQRFAAQFSQRKQQVRASLERLRSGGPLAMLGAGHLGTKFVNFMEVADLISFVADDHPRKCGLFLPGSRLPIKPTRALLQQSVRSCLLSVRPEREDAALKNLSEFLARGGETYSIFASSRRALAL